MYWRLTAEDLPKVKSGGIPDEVNNGAILYVAECAGTDGKQGLFRAMRQLVQSQPECKAVCWHGHWNDPDKFKYKKLQEAL